MKVSVREQLRSHISLKGDRPVLFEVRQKALLHLWDPLEAQLAFQTRHRLYGKLIYHFGSKTFADW